MTIDGFSWFVGALLICGAHALYLRSWQRERREHLAWWRAYDVRATLQHEALMHVLHNGETDLDEESA